MSNFHKMPNPYTKRGAFVYKARELAEEGATPKRSATRSTPPVASATGERSKNFIGGDTFMSGSGASGR